jgi:hypothetical protein
MELVLLEGEEKSFNTLKKNKRVSNGILAWRKLTTDTLMMNPKRMVKRQKVESAAFVHHLDLDLLVLRTLCLGHFSPFCISGLEPL